MQENTKYNIHYLIKIGGDSQVNCNVFNDAIKVIQVYVVRFTLYNTV